MPRHKLWWFEKKTGDVFIMCSNARSGAGAKPLTKNSGLPYGPVNKLAGNMTPTNTSTPSTSCPTSDNDMIKVIFFEGNPKVLSRNYFLWNINDFCQHLKPNPESPWPVLDIVEKFNAAMSRSNDDEDSSMTDDLLILSSSLDDETQQDEPNVSKKRKKQSTNDIPPLLKKQHTAARHAVPLALSEQYKLEARNAHLGHVKIYIQNLEPGKKIRAVSEDFVTSLQTQMEKYCLDSTYQPLCVVTKTLPSKENFTEANANGYKYEVIGGQHNLLATKALHNLHPEKELYKSRWCSVYYGDMSTDAMLYLANTHNVIGKYRHNMTFKDKVKMCHSIKAEKTTHDDQTVWKNKCAAILHEEPNGHFMRVVLFLAAQNNEIYEVVLRVLTMHEMGELKGQVLRKKDVEAGKADFRPYIFRPFLSLPSSALLALLMQVVRKDVDIATFQREAVTLVRLQRVQGQLIALLDAKTWNELEERFPEHTTREVLFQFTKGLKGETISESLRQYARMMKTREAMSVEQASFLTEAPFHGLNKAIGFQLQTKAEELTSNAILELCPTFLGFHLTVLDLPKNWEAAKLKSFLASLTALNLAQDCTGFTVIVLCQIDRQTSVQRCMEDTQQFQLVHRCFYHVPNTKPDGNMLAQSVFGLVIGHQQKPAPIRWALAGTQSNCIFIEAERLHRSEDGEVVDAHQKPIDLYRELVITFSEKQQWVLCTCCRTGTGVLASLKEGRNCIGIECSKDRLRHLQGRYNSLRLKTAAKKEQQQQPAPTSTDVDTSDVWDFEDLTDDDLAEINEELSFKQS